jgi:hypothetical protein
MKPRAHHAYGVRSKDLLDLEVAPDTLEIAHCNAKAIGMHGNRSRIDCTGGGAGHDWKRIDRACRQKICDGTQRTDLIGGTRTTSG